jgi:hypothetical protein
MTKEQQNRIIEEVSKINPVWRENMIFFFSKKPGEYNRLQMIDEKDMVFVNRYQKLRALFNEHPEWGCSISGHGKGPQFTIEFNY